MSTDNASDLVQEMMQVFRDTDDKSEGGDIVAAIRESVDVFSDADLEFIRTALQAVHEDFDRMPPLPSGTVYWKQLQAGLAKTGVEVELRTRAGSSDARAEVLLSMIKEYEEDIERQRGKQS